ncbi:MCE family protein [Rhodococcus wratislaviensis]|uniref:Mce family protein n=1 Tax=Rhodococcus wratislaviensis NBRC 100605 TaxID=1219028 RepID=X0RIS5_RHOWR|nr:MCE family protein [Rhodococcus wratislaviensis]GAF50960.1 Mce family protein [Rhodococcus wratislaviensis NBRC 100605]
MRGRPGGPGNGALAVRGVIGVAALILGSALLVGFGTGAIVTDPVVTATLPADAGAVKSHTTVSYKGATVGTVSSVDPGMNETGMDISLRPEQMRHIPASVQVRVVPRTLFGDQTVELVSTAGTGGARLEAGARLQPDTSAETVQMYDLYSKVYDMLSRVKPDQMQAALSAVADALRGRGEQLGHTIDSLHTVATSTAPLVESVAERAPQIARISEQLAAAAPDVLATMDAAVSLSSTLVENTDSFTGFLAASLVVSRNSGDVLEQNADNMIAVALNVSPTLGTMASKSDLLRATLDEAGPFGEAGAAVFSTGKFAVRVAADLSNPRPYTSADCPRYPGVDGPNCGGGGGG